MIVVFSLSLVSCSSKYDDVIGGTWYEQCEDGGTLLISGNQVTYNKGNIQQTSKFDVQESDKSILLIPVEQDFIYEDITYYFDDYSMLCYTKATSGGKGYISVLYGRGIYIAPEPNPGDLIDNTNDSAAKSISEYSIRSMRLSFNVVSQNNESDEGGEESEQYMDIGKYEYLLTTSEEGNAVLTSLYCPDVFVTDEWLSQLSDLVEELNIVALNGYDKRVYMLSDEYPDYTIDIDFISGESIHSSANSIYIVDSWYPIQKALNDLLYSAVLDGGYDPETGEFHTTQPIKRIGMSEKDIDMFGISTEEKRIEKNGKKYTYNNYVDYIVFSLGNSSHTSLNQSLKEINENIISSANADLEEHFSIMENVPAEDRKNIDNIYCYGFYQIDKLHSDSLLFCFRLSSGYSSNLITENSVQNSFSYSRYCFDSETGKRISPSQLFINIDWFEADIITRLLDVYKEGAVYDRINSTEFRSELHNMLFEPETYGYVEWEPNYHFFTIYIPESLIPELDYRAELQFYYDEYQDQLSDAYTSIW